MEELYELLKNPFDGLSKDEDIQERCRKIAQELFDNYCIKCNEKVFYFAETEFYYYEKGRWEKDWNKVTYPRKITAGGLFYHLSGVDICFESNLRKEEGIFSGKGGGLLIRSIVDKQGNLTIGPLSCVNKMLNECEGGCMPLLMKGRERRDTKPIEAYRFLGNGDFSIISEGKNKDGQLKLAYYDSSIEDTRWNNTRASYLKRLRYDYKQLH